MGNLCFIIEKTVFIHYAGNIIFDKRPGSTFRN